MAGSVAERRPFATVRPGWGALLPKGLFLAGLVYPFWYLLTPAGATDAWWVYWALAGLMLLPETMARVAPATRSHTRDLCLVVLAALTAWAVWLASANQMHPFYAVGSVAMGLNCAVALSSRRAFVGFALYVALLTAASFAWRPDPLKLAYWGPLYVMYAFAYGQLHARLRAEAEVLHHQRELERLVERRTATLVQRTRELVEMNGRLRHEIAEREQAEAKLRTGQKLEALGRLAGGVAHDFNNLLTIIGGMAEMLRDRLPAGSRERSDTEEICGAAARAADLTRNLLAFSRQETFDVITVDLNGALRTFRPMLDVAMGEDVAITLDLAPEPAWIRTNRSQLEQLFVNLAVNARDAMPDGGGLTIRTRVVAGDEGFLTGPAGGTRNVELVFRDTGVGMDEETRSRIFDPFFTTKEVGKGTGLGLATVYGFVEQTSGSIHVDSAPGRGTEFSIRWPYFEVEMVRNPLLSQGKPRATASSSVRKRILVVDDEPVLLRVVRRVLEDGGYEVLEACDSRSALRRLREGGDIDLLLTDVVMPYQSGIDLVQEVSKLRPELPIIFMSGHLNHPSLQKQELPGNAPLLSKPFPPSVLLARMKDAFEGSDFEGSEDGSRRIAPFPPLA